MSIISNDFKKELARKGYKIKFNDEIIKFTKKDDSVITMKISTIRKIFLNSLISHIDNIT